MRQRPSHAIDKDIQTKTELKKTKLPKDKTTAKATNLQGFKTQLADENDTVDENEANKSKMTKGNLRFWNSWQKFL